MKTTLNSLLLFFFLTLFTTNSTGQTQQIDSLRGEVIRISQSKMNSFSRDTNLVNTFLGIAKLFHRQNLDSSLHYCTQGLDLSKSIKWKLGESKSFYELGYRSFINRDYETAIDFYNKSIEIVQKLYPEIKGGSLAIKCYDYLAISYGNLGKDLKSVECGLLMLEIAEKIKDLDMQINANNALGNGYRRLEKNIESLTYFENGLEIAKKINNPSKQSILIGNIGLVYKQMGRFEEAISFYNQALELDVLLGNKLGQGRHYNNLGLVYQNKGELNKSIEKFEKSLTIFTEANNQNGISIALSGLAIVYSIKGDYSKSIDYNLNALRIFETLNNINLVLNTFNNIGIAYQYSGNIPKALDYFNKSIRLHNELDLTLNGYEYGNIAMIYSDYGSYELALQMQFKVLEISEKSNDISQKALCLGNIGNIYSKLKEYEKSKEYHTKSLELSASLGLKTAEANAMISLGNILTIQKKYDDALNYYYKAHQQYDSMGSIIYLANNCSNICKVYTHQKKYEQAIEQGKKAVNYALKNGNPDAIKGSSRNLYHAYRLNGEMDKAIINLALLRSTISNDLENNYLSFSEGERENYFASIEDDLSNYFDFAVEYHKDYPAFADTVYNLALSNKGLSLKSSTFIRNTILNSGDTSLIKDYNDFLELKKQISENFSKGIEDEELKTKTTELEKKLISRSGAYSDFNKIKNLDWKQIQAGLKTNEAAIEFINYKSYIDTSNQLYYAAVIIKKDSKHPQIVKLCTEEELKEVIGKFNGTNLNYVNKIYGTKSNGLEKGLYQKIWKPLEKELKGIKNIYYSPSGLLHKISFAAISISENTYLCDTYNLNQRSSTGKIASPTNVLYDQSDNFLIIGGVKYSSESITNESDNNEVWKYLPGTEQESQRINTFLASKKNNTTLLSAIDASESNFKAQVNKSTILHVSTHGFFYPDPKDVREELSSNDVEIIDEIDFRGTVKLDSVQRNATNYANWNFVLNKNPLMRSGIVLSGANEVWQRNDSLTTEDGILTSQEVSNLNLTNCKLVVLSACETGLGDIKGSEGVFGLQRAFKIAGAEYLIMSLWQVPDKETAEFMELFYRNLTKLKDISIAFNTTQKSMRKKYDPFYWAAFTLIN